MPRHCVCWERQVPEMNDITFGQYYPAKSVIHRMDARFKLVELLALIVFAFLAKSVVSAVLVALCTAVIILLTRVPVKMFLRSMKAIWFIIILTAALNMFYFPGQVIWSWWKLTITFEGVRQSCLVAMRLVCLMCLSSALTFTSTPTELTGAMESLLSPLKLVGVKVHELAMMMSIALRFVPTLMEETQKIMSAQKARGADLESGSIFKRVGALVPIIVPLFVSAFRRAYDLALAMETRCYTDGKDRTRLNEPKARFRDWVSLLLTIAVCVGVIYLNGMRWQDVYAACAGWVQSLIEGV